MPIITITISFILGAIVSWGVSQASINTRMAKVSREARRDLADELDREFE